MARKYIPDCHDLPQDIEQIPLWLDANRLVLNGWETKVATYVPETNPLFISSTHEVQRACEIRDIFICLSF